ncbi:MAG: RecB family exonuclease [Actinomycetota bacterium]
MDELLLDLPPLTKTAEEPGIRLSYSSLSTYETCPLQYKFRYVDKAPARPSPILSFGNALHEALKRWYNQPVPVAPPLGDLLTHLEDVWDSSSFGSQAMERSYKNHAKQVLTDFHAHNAPSFRIPVALEQRFDINIDGVRVTGVIDRMDRHPDGSYEIIDYKTNRRLPPLARVQENLQLSIYYIAAWEVWGIRPDKLTLYFLLPGQPLTTTRSMDDVAATRSTIARIAQSIGSEKFEPRESALCNWCDYQASCPLFKHQFSEEPPDIQAVIDEWIGRTKRTRADYAKLEQLERIIHDYCDANGFERVFGDGGHVTRLSRPDSFYDPSRVREALPPELLEQVLRIDDAAVDELLAGPLPDEIRSRLEEAKVLTSEMALRLKETRKR